MAESLTAITTGIGRFSYLHVFEARSITEGSPAKYSVSFLIPKGDKKTIDKIKAAEAEAIKQGLAKKWNGKKPKDLKSILKDGDDEDGDNAKIYAGHYFISCNASQEDQPKVVDMAMKPLGKGEVKSGDYGRIHVNIYTFASDANKGVAVYLKFLQKYKDGESLEGGIDIDDAFSDDVEDF